MRPFQTAALCFIVSAVAMSCTSPTPGKPGVSTPLSPTTALTTTPSASSSEIVELPFAGAPKVITTVDAGRFATDPCAIFTEAQTNELGVSNLGRQSSLDTGASCTWRSTSGGSINFSVLTKNPNGQPLVGLSGPYQRHKNGGLAWLKPLPNVEDQPAVAADIADIPGTCPVSVGLSDRLIFVLTVTQSKDKIGTVDRCDVAVRVAGMALKTMKTGG